MESDNRLQRIGKVRAPLGTAFGKGIMLKIVGVGQVVHAGQQCPELATVVHDATNGNPAKANAIIAALPPD